MKVRLIYIPLFVFYLFFTFNSYSEENVSVFKRKNHVPGLINLDFQNYIHIGSLDKEFSTVAHIAYDFSLLSIRSSFDRTICCGLTMLVHIYMFPRQMKFYVDNFYGAFGFYFGGTLSQRWAWRFYPVYHLSAHLSDGYTGDVATDKQIISNEMVYGCLDFCPTNQLEGLIGLGYYYNKNTRKDLTAKADLNFMWTLFDKRPLSPVLVFLNEFIHEKKVRYGMDIRFGLRIHFQSNRNLGIMFRYFKKPHPGQYFETDEKGYGVDIFFLI